MLIGAETARHEPAPLVEVADTPAAGDVFNAAFAAALAEGLDEPGALALAVATAACSVTREGAQSSMPTAQEVAAARADWRSKVG
jgi:ribokinase